MVIMRNVLLRQIAAIFYPSAHENVFFHHKDGNISGLNKGTTEQMLNLSPCVQGGNYSVP